MSTNKRIRGRKLQAIRKRAVEANPLCSGPDSLCEKEGRITLWQELDHANPIGEGGADTDSNRQGLCRACHAIKSGYRLKQRVGADGYPVVK